MVRDPSDLRVWQVGLGPVGRMIAERALRRGWRLVGASDPAHAGRSLRDLFEAPMAEDATVRSEGVAEEVDAAFVATVSDARAAAGHIESALPSADAVITTCEQLANPGEVASTLAERLDQRARYADTRVLAAGVNPGYAMDLFPLFATGASSGVERVEIVRRADVSDRRAPLQEKVGAGLSEEQFERGVDDEELGHRGGEASLRLVASALGRELSAVEEEVRGVPAQRRIRTDHVEVVPGEMRGVEHHLRGFADDADTPFVDFKLILAVGVDESVDKIEVFGEPNLSFEVSGGLPGDVCTGNVALNYAGVLLDAAPGLYDVTELPVPRPPV